MKSNIIIFCAILFIVASSLAFIYYKYEKPNKINDLEYVNVSIIAEVDGEIIATGYRIQRDGYLFSEGETLKDGAILVQVPTNSTYEFTTKNIENQTYYTERENIYVSVIKPYRVTLEISDPGELEVAHSLEKTNNKIILNLSSKGKYNDITYCLDWSSHFSSVKSLNDTLSEKKYFNDYVKCYDTGKSLDGDSFLVNLLYKEWGAATEDDYIKIFIFDKNMENNEIAYKEIGGSDIEYTISNI